MIGRKSNEDLAEEIYQHTNKLVFPEEQKGDFEQRRHW